MGGGIVIERGFSERDRSAIVAMLREYEAGLGVSLGFQHFEAELERLPGAYGPPYGQMLRATDDHGRHIGIVALRPVADRPDLGEMKRLYVRPAARGTGLGRALALAIMDEARRLGYRRICLDTLPSMAAAQALYRSLGFRQTGASSTEPTVLLFERQLGSP
jgi:ribosomal protein S18 acetylase RimI-like enzyme